LIGRNPIERYLGKLGNLRANVSFATVPLRQAINYAKNYFETHAEVLEAQSKFWG
jgi:hypothetical protein